MRQFAALFVAAIITTSLTAETRCPANVKAIPFRNVNQHQMIVGVSVNHSGPYEFLLDTGTQMTVVDRSLAAELHIPTTGSANVAGVSFHGEAMFAQLDTIEIGDHLANHQGVLVYSMKSLQAAGFAIRGLLGEDFLSRFDVLIDNANHVLCMDDTGIMRDGMKGAQSMPVPRGCAMTSCSDRPNELPPGPEPVNVAFHSTIDSFDPAGLPRASTEFMFSADHLFASRADARSFLDKLPVNSTDQAKIAHGNVEHFLGILNLA